MEISLKLPALLLSLLTTTAADAGISQCHPSKFTFPLLPGAAHIRTTAAVVRNYTGHAGWMPDAAVSVPPSGVAPFCNVTTSYTHPGYDFVVSVHVWLPLERQAWNGRFLGVGGGGFVAGDVDGDFMAAGVMGGYAVAATDGGHWKGAPVKEWAVKSKGNLDWERFVEFAFRGVGEMGDVGGAVGGYGYIPGAPLVGLLGLMNVRCDDDGGCEGEPFEVAEDWIKYFVKKDPEFDVGNMTMEEFRDVFRQGVEEFTSAIGTSHDLRRFRERGGKMLMWHGMADQTVMVLAARAFYERAKKLEESRGVEVEDYWRYFEVPGMNHCSPIYGGPYPWDAMERLQKWVEEGVPPQDLEARTVGEKDGRKVFGKEARRVCMFPKEGVWDGSEWRCLLPGEKLDETREEL
ncbi:putative feruloyl esterase B-2 [Colletotrichum gloeosporioides]|uniref:Carboxylic ester hydrolase n=1 Tax=Colletotrichum gloeosporioides TaxID=474922 RepID=A0A8H4CCH7_COLGL|nr:putative feruloyl esterase B-2 [Colletotrichum gloeosporioides]KAF3801263.1 putative feruloyl esterase B-2 [Colletotrichum gloeosporioides]